LELQRFIWEERKNGILVDLCSSKESVGRVEEKNFVMTVLCQKKLEEVRTNLFREASICLLHSSAWRRLRAWREL
jgi:hypothetical protein